MGDGGPEEEGEEDGLRMEPTIPRKKDLNREIEKKIQWLLSNDATLKNRKHLIRCAINHFYNWKKENLQKFDF